MTILSPLRKGRITGSRVPMVLGISPYNSRDGVLREMVRQHFGAPQEFTGNIATDWGNDHEGDAITEYEKMRGELVYGGQEIVLHKRYDFLAVTPDGLVGEDGLVEAKCPYAGTYAHISERPDHQAQIQLQMECTGRAWTDFVVWRPSGVSISRLDRDTLWLDRVMPELDAFMAEYREATASEEAGADFLRPLVDERTDPEWQLAALEWKEAKLARDRYQQLMDAATDDLRKLADGKKSKGYGVQVIPTDERKGAVDWEAASKDGFDAEKYRKPPTTPKPTVREAAL